MLDRNNESKVYEVVNRKYSEIATRLIEQKSASCCSSDEIGMKSIENTDRILSLGSDNNLIQYANPIIGETVVDLGSGPGRDVIEIAEIIGKQGKVIGIDFSEEMIVLALNNIKKGNLSNIEIRKGVLTEIPVTTNSVNLVISNCVINLVPNKQKVFDESFRILKSGGRMVISDIIKIKLNDTSMVGEDDYCGCLTGATIKEYYLNMMRESGLINIQSIVEYEFTRKIDNEDREFESRIFIGYKP